MNKSIFRPGQHVQNIIVPIHCSKLAHHIERAATSPSATIAAVFSEIFHSDLTEDLLPNWLQVAITNKESPYSKGNGQEILTEFYEWLLQLVEALYLLSDDRSQNQPVHLTVHQQANPMEVITDFFTLFTIDYARRELRDFLDAAIGYDGNYMNALTPWLALMTYNHITCLVEAAFQLYFIHETQNIRLLIIDAVPIEKTCD